MRKKTERKILGVEMLKSIVFDLQYNLSTLMFSFCVLHGVKRRFTR